MLKSQILPFLHSINKYQLSLPPSHQFAKLNGEEKPKVHNKWSLFYKALFSQRAFSGYENKTCIYETLNTEK